MLIKSFYDDGIGPQYRDHTITYQQYTPYPANGTDTNNGVSYAGYETSINRYVRLAESNFKRTYAFVTTLSSTLSSAQLNDGYIFTNIASGIWVGQLLLIVRRTDNKKLLAKVLHIDKYPNVTNPYQKVYISWTSGEDETASDSSDWPLSFDYGDEVYDASRMKYTKPSASSDLLRNNWLFLFLPL